MKDFAHARNSASVVPLPSRVEHSASRIGKNSAIPAGTVTSRVTVKSEHVEGGSGQKLPVRNHTWPDCPTAPLAPVKSLAGLVAAGIESSHFQCSADHWPELLP